MANRIIKQPNGKYAIYSTIVDDFTLLDASPEDIINEWVERERTLITNKVKEIVRKLEEDKKPYFQFTKSFDETVEDIKEMHGEDTESLRMLRDILGKDLV